MAFLLALDEGTSSARAIVFNERGEQLGLGRHTFAQHFPQPGWVEHDPEEIWAAQQVAVQEALQSAGIVLTDVAAIGLTNQRETTVLWDRQTGQPLGNAIVWQDRRTADYCHELIEQGHQPDVLHRTGLRIDPYFSAPKLRWVLDHWPAARQLAEQSRLAFGTIDSWLIWKLTAGHTHATDASNASRTLLYNYRTHQWDDHLLQLFGLPSSLLPEVRNSADQYGLATTLGAPIPIAGVAGDQQAALFGQACFRPGDVKNTYGTGCFLLMNAAQAPPNADAVLGTVAWRLNNQTTYAYEGAIFSAGASVGWLVELGLLNEPAEADELAASVPHTGDCYMVPAFAGLGTPHWDPYARGTIMGLTRGTSRAHLARAALEAMAYQSDEVLQAMRQASGIAIATLRVDGGASESELLMQFQANLSGVRIERPTNLETTAWGAAALAGLQVGVFRSLEEVAAVHRLRDSFSPTLHETEREQRRHRWAEATRRSRNWVV